MIKYTNNYSIRYTEELNQPLVEQKKGKTMLDKFSGSERSFLINTLMCFLLGKNRHSKVAEAAYIQATELNRIFGDNYKERLKDILICVNENYKPSQAHVSDGITKAFIFTTEAKKSLLEIPKAAAHLKSKGIELYVELVSVKMIDALLENNTSFKNEEDKMALRLFRSCVSNDGKNIVSYRRTKGPRGRRFAASPSLQTLPKYIRFKILGTKTTDIDFANCHPTLISAFAREAGLKNDALNSYISDREERLKEIMDHFSCSRDAAKKLMLMLSYGANLTSKKKNSAFKEWLLEEAVTVTSLPEFLKEFAEELKEVRGYILRRDDASWLSAEERSYEARGMALYIQDIEDRLLRTCEGYMKYLGINVQTLMFDGLMITGEISSDQLLGLENILSSKINEELGLNINLKLTAKVYEGAE
jgi:hypothetical protein